MQKILVTGATGFIGSHVCRRLAQNPAFEVRALVRPGSDVERLADLDVALVHGDLTVPASLDDALAEIDQVVHLAAATQVMRTGRFEVVNVEGTRALAEAARRAGVRRFVFTSSLSAQGPSQPGAPHVEAGDEAPITPYGQSKLQAEALLRRQFTDLSPVVLRPAVVYGPHDPELLTWLRFFEHRMVPSIPGLEVSFVYIDDLVSLIATILEAEQVEPGPFFVSDGTPLDLDAALDAAERALGNDPAVRIPIPRAALRLGAPMLERITGLTGIGRLVSRTLRELAAPAWGCVPARATAAFDWQPEVNLSLGLARTVRWYREAGLI